MKVRFSEHKRPSSVNSEVSKYINCDHPDHSILLDNVKVLEVKPKWFERGFREAIQIRKKNPTLNKDAGRYKLPPVWNNTLRKRGRRGGPSPRTSKPGVDVSQRPQLHHTTWRGSDEAYSMQVKAYKLMLTKSRDIKC